MRVVTHACSNTEIVCALGCGDYLVGCDDDSDFPAECTAQLPKIGRDLEVRASAVSALRPDLIIASLTVPGHERVVADLKTLGVPMLVTAPRNLDDVIGDVLRIGEALGVPGRAQSLAERMRAELSPRAPASSRPRILIEWWPKPLIVPGRQSWATDLLERAGACNPWADRDCESLPIEFDEARAAAPDAIVMSWCGVQAGNYRPEVVARRPGWDALEAVRCGRIYAVSEAYLGRPGPRLVEGLARLAKLVDACTR